MLTRLVSLVAVATVAAALAPASPAQAILAPIGICPPLHYCTSTWYVDSTRTYVAGRLTVTCGGHAYSWGTRTRYEEFAKTAC